MIKRKSTILSDVRVGRTSVKTLGCSCADNAFIVNVLKRLNLNYVAGMHARSETEWTPKDWFLHAKQEDEYLFPMLIKIAKEDKYLEDGESEQIITEVNDLISDHIKYVYPACAKNELPDESIMKVHGDRENKLIKKYYRQLLHLPITTLIDRKTKVGVGGVIDFEIVGDSAELSPVSKIALGITVGGLALSFGAPILVAAFPLFAAGASVVKTALEKTVGDDGIPRVQSIQVELWKNNVNSIPGDKINNRGQKFIDPYGLPGSCWPTSGMDNIMSLPKTGMARATYMHNAAQSSTPTVMPAADVLIATANSFEASAMSGVEKDLKDRTKWWADQIRKYARYTGNGYIIAFAELYAWILTSLPASWNVEYRRSQALAEDLAVELQATLMQTIAFSLPYPLHVLDGSVDSLDDLRTRTGILRSNLRKSLCLPNSGKTMIAKWFSLFASMCSTDPQVQSAITWVDNSEWGRRNLASDEQVYLVGLVFARSINQDPVKFVAELWDRALGWSGYPGLLTNSHFTYLDIDKDVSPYSYTWDQNKLGRANLTWWKNPKDEETGYSWAAECVTNAREVQLLDLVLTGWQMVAEKTNKPPVIENTKKININSIEAKS